MRTLTTVVAALCMALVSPGPVDDRLPDWFDPAALLDTSQVVIRGNLPPGTLDGPWSGQRLNCRPWRPCWEFELGTAP